MTTDDLSRYDQEALNITASAIAATFERKGWGHVPLSLRYRAAAHVLDALELGGKLPGFVKPKRPEFVPSVLAVYEGKTTDAAIRDILEGIGWPHQTSQLPVSAWEPADLAAPGAHRFPWVPESYWPHAKADSDRSLAPVRVEEGWGRWHWRSLACDLVTHDWSGWVDAAFWTGEEVRGCIRCGRHEYRSKRDSLQGKL